jgi:FkbM family methyltransferase
MGIPKRALKRYIPEDAVIVEAGAHHGFDTTQFARLWPEGRIYAFEPVPHVYEELERNTAHCGNVTTYQLALGDKDAVMRMWLSDRAHDYSSSLLEPRKHLDEFPEIGFEETTSVRVTTLASWAAREGIDRIDGMWLDMQGYELAALKAAGPILETTRAVILEVSATELYAGVPLWPEVQAWLEGQGFQIEQEHWYRPSFGDVLAARADRRRDRGLYTDAALHRSTLVSCSRVSAEHALMPTGIARTRLARQNTLPARP